MGLDEFNNNFPIVPQTNYNNQLKRVSGSAFLSGVSFACSLVPTEAGHDGDFSLAVADRARIVSSAACGCCVVVGRAAKGWVCLSCPEIHVVPRPGWYSPEKYQRKEKARRARLILAGKCVQCGADCSAKNKRLCERHRIETAKRKQRWRRLRAQHAIEMLYAGKGKGIADGKFTFTNT
jgi:hypothetical protein